MKVIVIGAGASGIIAALKASENHEVILLEKNSKIGKKILVTGNGKCNLWNKSLFSNNFDINKYNTDNYSKLKEILEYRSEVYEYLTRDLNIITKENGEYIYPYSMSAASIQKLLEDELKLRTNIDVVCNVEVINISKKENKFVIEDQNGKTYDGDKVVLACGEKSHSLGTNTLSKLMNELGIDVLEEFPSLVPVTLDEKFLKDWENVRADAKLSLYIDDELVKEELGEVLLTSYGISGISTFNISGYISRNKDLNKYIIIDFMPEYSLEELLSFFKKIKSNKKVDETLETLFNYKLLYVILSKAGINKDVKWKDLDIDILNKLVSTIKKFKVKAIGTLGFDRSQVTTGGVSLNEVTDSLEVQTIPGLYLIGEILNVDAICGGYNLAFAFITGYIVGKSL